MKKLFVAVLAVVFFAPVAFGGGWGLGAKLGYGENDPKTMKDWHDAVLPSELDENGGIFGVEGFYEWDLADVNKLGVKFGFDVYGENEVDNSAMKATETTGAIPLSVYFKQDYGIENWSWFAGAGMTFLATEVEVKHNDDEDKSILFPHLLAGVEYRFTEVFALGFEAKYNINAKVKKHGAVLSDRSGLSGAVTFRFYL